MAKKKLILPLWAKFAAIAVAALVIGGLVGAFACPTEKVETKETITEKITIGDNSYDKSAVEDLLARADVITLENTTYGINDLDQLLEDKAYYADKYEEDEREEQVVAIATDYIKDEFEEEIEDYLVAFLELDDNDELEDYKFVLDVEDWEADEDDGDWNVALEGEVRIYDDDGKKIGEFDYTSKMQVESDDEVDDLEITPEELLPPQ